MVIKGDRVPRFPTWGNDILSQNNVRIFYTDKSVVEAFPWLNGRHPRNHPSGTTYNQIRGVYLPEQNALAFNPSDGPYEGSGSFNTGIHEGAHALDTFGGFSQSEKFDVAWKSNYDNFKLDYYKYQNSGYSESFAEGFARYFGGDKTMKKDWPDIYKYMKNLDSCMSKSGKNC